MKKWYIATILIIGILSFSAITFAETTKFRQQIVPIDCIYEVIDVGTQKLRYLTPDTCPIDPGPPVVTEPSTPKQVPTVNSGGNSWSYNPPIVIAPPTQNPEDEDEEVKGEIQTIRDVIYINQDSIVMVFIIASIWWLVLLTRHYYKKNY